MFCYRIEPVYLWGLEPCEGMKLPSTNTSVTAGGADTRRTRPGSGAAYSRSNVAEQFSSSYGRHLWREKENTNDNTKKTSSAAAPSSKKLLAMDLFNHCSFSQIGGFLISFVRKGLSATSKIALERKYA